MLLSLAEYTFAELADPCTDPARLLVLTVNNRHARRLLMELSQNNAAHPVRQAPRIVPLSAWMQQMAQALSFTQAMPAHVLDAFGTQHLWAQVIAQEEPQRPLLDTQQTARLAMEADRLMVEWQLDFAQDVQTLETARFLQWRKHYLAQLKRLDAQDPTRILQCVLDAVAHQALPLTFDLVVFAGFSQLSPLLQTLLTHWQTQGVQLMRLASAPRAAIRAVRTVTPTHEAQWRAAATWAARQLQHHPQGRFAIVAAQLEVDMPFAHRVLHAALHDMPYNIAVARPLSAWPLVRSLLAWLRVLSAYTPQSPSTEAQDLRCETARVGAALLADAVGVHALNRPTLETDHYAVLDARWRRQGAATLSYQTFMAQLNQHAPSLAKAWIHAWGAAIKTRGESSSLDTWITHFRREIFLRFGLASGTTHDSATYQTLQALETALDRAAGQAFTFGDLRRDQALNILESLLQQTPFQPMQDAAARLDVLGMLEAEGGHWDAVWVLGLHDTNLPAVPQPNPLLPLTVLRRAGTPRATLARELQWAQSMRTALLACAPHVLFSHAQEHNTEPLRPSPLLADLPEIALAQAVQGNWSADNVMPEIVHTVDGGADTTASTMRLEVFADDQGPPVDDKPLRGGIGVIDTQARHPLWAFVKYRLGASRLEDYARVAQANTRGNFLHYCLELIWRMLPDQAALHQTWEQDRVTGLVQQAVIQAAEKHLQDYRPTLKRLEMQRAATVVHECLEIECKRPPFRIQAVEKSVVWREGLLELRVRLDRVDALDDGGLAVIDYKTGASHIAVRQDWMRDRPVNLQLPFYAVMLPHAPQQVQALMLVKLHARGVELRGLARDLDLKGISAPAQWPLFENMAWDEVMQYWRTAIQAIAHEVEQGVATNVVRNAADLQYCDVLPFLRLNETVTAGEPHDA